MIGSCMRSMDQFQGMNINKTRASNMTIID